MSWKETLNVRLLQHCFHKRHEQAGLTWDWVANEGFLEEATFNTKEKLPPGRGWISLAPWGQLLSTHLLEWSGYGLAKCTLWWYLNISSHDFSHSPLSVSPNKNQCSLLGKRKITTKIRKHIFVSKKDNSMVIWVPTDTVISFPSVLPFTPNPS